MYICEKYFFMKTYISLFCLLFIGLAAQAQSKIGTIDADYIIAQMPEMEEVNENLKAYDTQLQEDLKENVATYETKVEDYRENRETYTEEELAQKEQEIIGLENDLKNFRQRAQVMMQMRRNELSKPLYEKIDVAMQEVISEENFTHVFHAGGNSLAFAAESHDITVKVLAKLGIEPQTAE